MATKKPPQRGAGNPSDEYLDSLYDRVHLRLPLGYRDALEEEAREAGSSKPMWVADAIDVARRKKGKPALVRKR